MKIAITFALIGFAMALDGMEKMDSKIFSMTNEEYLAAKFEDRDAHDDLDDVDIYGDDSSHWQNHEVEAPEILQDRNFITSWWTDLWPNKEVIYQWDPSASFSYSDKALIKSAMAEISRVSCVKYKERTTEEKYLMITNTDDGCYNLGTGYLAKSSTQMKINLQPNGCMYKGTIIHEFLHNLGFGHEQKRHDRNSYIRVNWYNIITKSRPQYWRDPGANDSNAPKCDYNNIAGNDNDRCVSPGGTSNTFGIPYDYGSIMHYGPDGFSANGRPTMTALRSGGEVMGNRKGMSSSDIKKLNKAYKCGAAPPPPPPTTTNAPVGTKKNRILKPSANIQELRPDECGVIRSHDSYPSGMYSGWAYRYWYINTSCHGYQINCPKVAIKSSNSCWASLSFRVPYSTRTWCQWFSPISFTMSSQDFLSIHFSASNEQATGFQCEICPVGC